MHLVNPTLGSNSGMQIFEPHIYLKVTVIVSGKIFKGNRFGNNGVFAKIQLSEIDSPTHDTLSKIVHPPCDARNERLRDFQRWVFARRVSLDNWGRARAGCNT